MRIDSIFLMKLCQKREQDKERRRFDGTLQMFREVGDPRFDFLLR